MRKQGNYGALRMANACRRVEVDASELLQAVAAEAGPTSTQWSIPYLASASSKLIYIHCSCTMDYSI